jgi:hypothetical protein
MNRSTGSLKNIGSIWVIPRYQQASEPPQEPRAMHQYFSRHQRTMSVTTRK